MPNWVRITNVYPGDCIPLIAGIQVDYSNESVEEGKVGLGCGGAQAPPDQNVGKGTTGTLTFKLEHPATGAGHTLSAALKGKGVQVPDSVSPVNVGNPCPIKFDPLLPPAPNGMPSQDPNKPSSGTFEIKYGDQIHLMIEDPGKLEGGKLPPPQLLYVDQAKTAKIDDKEWKWSHDAIPTAKKGLLLKVVLSKDGVVRSTIRAMFV
jgi:hypothetical protein